MWQKLKMGNSERLLALGQIAQLKRRAQSILTIIKSKIICPSVLLYVLLSITPSAIAGTINVGVGLEFADGDNFNGFDAGQIYQIGYEFDKGED